jgi:hypothetical protein
MLHCFLFFIFYYKYYILFVFIFYESYVLKKPIHINQRTPYNGSHKYFSILPNDKYDPDRYLFAFNFDHLFPVFQDSFIKLLIFVLLLL